MKTAAIIINIFFPPIGSFIVGKWGQGIGQFILLVIAAIFIATAIGAILGVPIAIVAWIWAIVCAATSQPSAAPAR